MAENANILSPFLKALKSSVGEALLAAMIADRVTFD